MKTAKKTGRLMRVAKARMPTRWGLFLTNNPRKSRALSDAGIEVVARIPCEVAPTPYSLAYLRAKKEKMGHSLSLRLTPGLT
jgi:hypothetical protein